VNAGANDKTSGGWNRKKDYRGTTCKEAMFRVAPSCLAEGEAGMELLPSGDEAGRGGRSNPSRASGKGVKFETRRRGERAHGL